VPDDSFVDSDEASDAASIKRRRAERLKETGGWLGYIKDFSIFVPFLIPRHNRKVQLCFALSLVAVVANRLTTVLIPRQVGIITDEVLESRQPPYAALAVWLGLSLLDEYRGMGLLQSLVKIPIRQFSSRQISNAAFNHIMTLSMDFHSERDSAELIKAVEQGHSLADILETLVVELLPMLGDIAIAAGLFWYKFNALVGLTVVLAAIAYACVEAVMLRRNVRNQREQTRTDREGSRVMHQAVQAWQTVTYFNMFGFERGRYAKAVDDNLKASRDYLVMDAVTDFLLEALELLTFLVLAVMVLREISHGQATAGDFVFVLQYWQTVIWPIRLIMHRYKDILKALVDAERLLALLKTPPSVADRPDALQIHKVEGYVSLEDVHFAYDERRPTISDLSLRAEPGQTVAFVGATGAGKSTITKLLLRLYDVSAGRITIDGRDIRDVTLSSLRAGLGVVPQDPQLFNATVMENLRYARPDASDEQVFEACRKAAIHDKIVTTLADGYETKVGEQGVKLSGGEVQRLAIARVFLKDPAVLILDEATSAVDTETEHSIQMALEELKKGRTTFVIAHRLSTVVGADKIVVVSDGKVVESGTHAELVAMEGKYTALWARQTAGTTM
jgi:ABC-type transport system involved in Fe-S cluster assembly fused permease/ATPase subunit